MSQRQACPYDMWSAFAQPPLAVDIDKWQQCGAECQYHRIDEVMFPRKLRHSGEVDTVESPHQRWRQEHSVNNSENLDDLVLLYVENIRHSIL